jgi:hypothetical protein
MVWDGQGTGIVHALYMGRECSIPVHWYCTRSKFGLDERCVMGSRNRFVTGQDHWDV